MLFAKRRLLCAWHCAFIICCYADSRDLHSFPTRRSSDLRETGALPEAGMQSRPDQGALLTILARLVGARNAVEVGTFTGYGAICIARGLAEGGRLTCFEVSERYAEIARRNLELAGVADRVTIEVGPAIQRLDTLDTVDLAYVDADKPGYPAYYDALIERVRPGGLLILDHTL